MAVDDHQLVVESLVCLLADEADPEVAGIARIARQAFAQAATESSEVVLLDLRVPGTVAPAYIAQLALSAREVSVLVLARLGDETGLLASRGDGSSDSVAKECAARQLVETLRVADGEVDIGDDRRRDLDPSISHHRGRPKDLSRRELDVLSLVALGCSTAEIAHRLHLSTNTVRNHVQRTLTKLGVHSRIEAVNEARRRRLISAGGHTS